MAYQIVDCTGEKVSPTEFFDTQDAAQKAINDYWNAHDPNLMPFSVIEYHAPEPGKPVETLDLEE